MPELTTPSGLTLHYDDAGAGRPLLFLHGWAMSGRVWRFQQPLSDRYRLVFLDQRGHGQSSAGAGYTVDDYAGDLADFLERMELEGVVLIGWSMGVQVALQAFPAIRARLAALVLVGGTPRFTTAEVYPHGQAPVEVKGMGVRLRRDYGKTMGEFFRGMFAEGEMESAHYQRIVHEIVIGGHSPDQQAARESLKILSTVDQRELLPRIDRPVLLVHGDRDLICPASASAYMAKRLPMGTLEVMQGCGHAPFMTRPERFNELVRAFLGRL